MLIATCNASTQIFNKLVNMQVFEWYLYFTSNLQKCWIQGLVTNQPIKAKMQKILSLRNTIKN